MMTGSFLLTTIAVFLGAAGTYLLLPHSLGLTKSRTAYGIGGVLAGAGLIAYLGLAVPSSDYLAAAFFYVFAASALGAALMTVTSRNPVYSALWFAGVVVSSAGLFLLADAPFLAAGTVIVYAGAIIVTFLFVIMLAQLEGQAVYDRSARTPGRAVFTCFLLLWCLVACITRINNPTPTPADKQAPTHRLFRVHELVTNYRLAANHPARVAVEHASPATSSLFSPEGLPKPNVAGLGESLYTDYIVAVELAGALLFVALVAAVAIANPGGSRPGGGAPKVEY